MHHTNRSHRMRTTRFALFAALAAAAFGLAPEAALAAPSFGFDPSCSDRSVSDYLVPIFGTLFSQCGGAAGAFQRVMAILNAGALTIGGILAACTLVAGTMQTAHDGEMLGKRWSSMWLPIRTALGVGLVVPLGSGYCVAQMVVGFLIGQGVGFADSVWSTYLTTMAMPAGMAPLARLPNVNDLAKGVLQSQLCMAAYNAARASGDNSMIMPDAMANVPNSPNVHAYGIGGKFECGGTKFDKIQYDKLQATPANGMTGVTPMDGTVVDPTTLTAIDTAHMAALTAMEASLKTTATKLVTYRDGPAAPPDVVADLNAAVAAYQTAVTGSVASVFSNGEAMSTFLAAANSDGWYMAGGWFMKATQMQDAVSQAVSRVPTSIAPNEKQLAPWSTTMAPYFVQMQNVLRTGSQNQSSMDATLSAADDLGDSSNPFKKAVAGAAQSIFSLIQVNPNRNALMSIKDLGDYVMVGSEITMTSGIALVAGGQGAAAFNNGIAGWVVGFFTAGTANAAIGAGAGALTAIGYIMMAVGSIFFGLGAAIAIYLPLAPFLLYFGAFVGWLILCGEAVIAAPLWAVMHLTQSGDDFMGGAKSGYMMLLGLLLRPVLIVLGFIFALTAVNVVAQGFNGIFFPMFRMAMAGSLMGLGTGLVLLSIYFGSMVWIFHTVFGLIHVIPDKLLRWIGGGGESLGQSAQGLSKAGESGTGSASRHADAIRSQAITGIGMAANVSATRRGQEATGAREAAGQLMQMKTSGNKAAIASAKADGPESTSEDQLESVSSHLGTALQTQQAMNAQQSSDKLSGNRPNEAAATVMKDNIGTQLQKAEARVQGMEGEAKQAESQVASASAEGRPAAEKQASAKKTAAAHGQEMLMENKKSLAQSMANNLAEQKVPKSSEQYQEVQEQLQTLTKEAGEHMRKAETLHEEAKNVPNIPLKTSGGGDEPPL